MAQLSLYMTDASMKELKKDAEAEGKSISSYARDILTRRHESERDSWKNGWPPGFFDLYGSSPNFPDVEDLPPRPVETW